ncbi:hypothetical protein SAMN05216258_105400 [Albimonas pacifica]|uniref:Uncharacterized protein n=1 Tax=Albimonas pacifica TaxID=1114924 RepID=A0A1I3GXW5_9RHOB|nr:hypothetical protein SAMN05216258_105400 [Albimonas pacifica]
MTPPSPRPAARRRTGGEDAALRPFRRARGARAVPFPAPARPAPSSQDLFP